MILQNRRRGEKGNILFLILLAVVLFAALSYAVTQSLRGGGQNANNEKNLVKSATITQYPVGVRAAILRMIVGGTSPAALFFDPPSVFADISSTADQALEVFHPSGGGAVFALVPSDAMATASSTQRWYFNRDFEVPGIGTSVTSSDDGNDLIAFADGLDSTLCQRINTELGVSSIPVLTAAQTITTQQTKYDKGNTSSVIVYTSSTAGTNHITDNATVASAVTNNKPYLCVRNGSSGNYVYYHVLVER